MGSIDWPFNPLSLAIGAEATFVARAIDTDKKGMTDVLRAAAEHRGSAFVEIFQNCPRPSTTRRGRSSATTRRA